MATIGVGFALLALGLLLQTRDEVGDSGAQATPESRPILDEPLVVGPYRVVPSGYEGQLPIRILNPRLSADQLSRVATDTESAQASSLFPRQIPDGYQVVTAHSAGRSSELHLELTLSGPSGELLVTRSRPEESPVDVYINQERLELQLAAGRVLLLPKAGYETTEATIAHGFEAGIATSIQGQGLSRDEVLALLLPLARSLPPSASSSMFPEPPEEGERVPQADDLVMTGPCTITPSITKEFETSRGVGLRLTATFTCSGVVEAKPCPPIPRRPALDYAPACDADDLFIDTHWNVAAAGSRLASNGRTAVLDDGSVASAISWAFGASPGQQVAVEVCVHLRFTDTCARFSYSAP